MTPQNNNAAGNLTQPNSGSIQHLNKCYFKQTRTLLLAILTLSIPPFHKSLVSPESKLGLPEGIVVWKMTRNFSSLLVCTLIAALFNPNIQTSAVVWFLISHSLLLAILGLTCSYLLIVCFLNRNTHNHDPDDLKFPPWSVWNLFALPCILTAWSAVTFAIALFTEVILPGVHPPGQTIDCRAARVVLSLSICMSCTLFAFFLLHLRHLTNVFSRVALAHEP